MEELKNAMELLKEMRGVIGEVVYAAEVKNLLESFPVFKSFEKSVMKIDIIDLVDDCDDDEADAVVNKPRAARRHSPRFTCNGSDTSVTEPDLSSITVHGCNSTNVRPKHWPHKDEDDGDDNVPSAAAGDGDGAPAPPFCI